MVKYRLVFDNKVETAERLTLYFSINPIEEKNYIPHLLRVDLLAGIYPLITIRCSTMSDRGHQYMYQRYSDKSPQEQIFDAICSYLNTYDIEVENELPIPV